MQVTRVGALELSGLRSQWNGLTHVPFCTWQWMLPWWQHYGPLQPRAEPLILCVRDETDAIVGIAPWYLGRSASQGSVIRFLGSGQVCSDYLSVLSQANRAADVAQALADWLCDRQSSGGGLGPECPAWDTLVLEAVAANDEAVRHLADALSANGCQVDEMPGTPCWRIPLPADWDGYLAGLSKSHRKQVRQCERRLFDTGRVQWKTAKTAADFDIAWPLLIQLHQARRQSLGEPGLFAFPPFASFHAQAARQLLDEGMLRLSWLALDGRPIAAEYHIAAGKIVYAYQSGLAPDALEHEPGRLAMIAVLRSAIADGYESLDLLRGDESYKAHWRAEPRPMINLRAWRRSRGAQVRRGVWLAGKLVKNWLRKPTGQSIRPRPTHDHDATPSMDTRSMDTRAMDTPAAAGASCHEPC